MRLAGIGTITSRPAVAWSAAGAGGGSSSSQLWVAPPSVATIRCAPGSSPSSIRPRSSVASSALYCARAQRWTMPTATGRCARGSPVRPSAEITQPRSVRARYIASVPGPAYIDATLQARAARTSRSRCSLRISIRARTASAISAVSSPSGHSSTAAASSASSSGCDRVVDTPWRSVSVTSQLAWRSSASDAGAVPIVRPSRAIARTVRPAVRLWRSSTSPSESSAVSATRSTYDTLATSPADSSIAVRAGLVENGTTNAPRSSGTYSRSPSHARASGRGRPASSRIVITAPAAPTRTTWRSRPLWITARLDIPLPIRSIT